MTLNSQETILKWTAATFVCSVLLVSGPDRSALAQTEKSANTVIEKHLEAMGGREALQRIHSRVSRGSFSLPSMGVYAAIETSVQPPDKMLMDIEGMASSGVNGDIAWDINPMAGARLLQGGEKSAAKRRAQLEPLLEWEKHFSTAELGDNKTVQGIPCLQLILTPPEGEAIRMLIDQESYLLKQIEVTAESGEIITRVSDYREVDGVKIPFKITIDMPQISIDIDLEKVEHNLEIPAERFAIPSQIRSLLEGQ